MDSATKKKVPWELGKWYKTAITSRIYRCKNVPMYTVYNVSGTYISIFQVISAFTRYYILYQ